MAMVPGASDTRSQISVLGVTQTASAAPSVGLSDADGLPADVAAVNSPTDVSSTVTAPPASSPPIEALTATTANSPATNGAPSSTSGPSTLATPRLSPADDVLSWPNPIPLTVGTNEQQMPFGGYSRSYIAVLPPPSAKPRSLLIVLHGVNGRGANMRAMGFEPAAAANGTVVVYPDAIGGSWNDGRIGMEPMQPGMVTDDVAFLRALVDEMVSRAGVDETRVAVAGFSNGAMMAGRAACDMADRIRGVAMVGGTAGQNYSQVCLHNRSMPIVEVHGTSDPIVPYLGGKVADNQGHKRGTVLSVVDFVSFWSGTCHCSGTHETAIKAALPVTMVEAQSCTPGSPVVHYRVTGGAHEWFRIQGFDTTKVVWDFLAANAFV
jgi:polyhydroxybutyrate depolymerase